MPHWSEKYLTLEYDKASFVCTDFVARVLSTQAGLSLPIPPSTEWRKVAPDNLGKMYDDKVSPVQEPDEFDLVLMRIMGNKRSLGSHLGIYTVAGGRGRVLHILEGQGARLDLVGHVQYHGLEVLGYFRCR